MNNRFLFLVGIGIIFGAGFLFYTNLFELSQITNPFDALLKFQGKSDTLHDLINTTLFVIPTENNKSSVSKIDLLSNVLLTSSTTNTKTTTVTNTSMSSTKIATTTGMSSTKITTDTGMSGTKITTTTGMSSTKITTTTGMSGTKITTTGMSSTTITTTTGMSSTKITSTTGMSSRTITTTTSTTTKSGVTNPGTTVICCFDGGRVGSQMSTLASLLAMEWNYGARAYLNPFQVNILRPYFHSDLFYRSVRKLNKDFPDWINIKWTSSSPDIFNPDRSHWPPKKEGSFIEVPNYINHVILYSKYLGKLREIFQIDNVYREEARMRLQNLSKNIPPGKNQITFISIHGRRADYSNHMKINYNLTYVEDNYFKRAINHYRKKYQNILFYIVSEDTAWAKSSIENKTDHVYYMDILQNSFLDERPLSNDDIVGIDMALLSMANHSIMSYGTFGMWGALLAGGSIVYPKSHVKVDTAVNLMRANLTYLEFI